MRGILKSQLCKREQVSYILHNFFWSSSFDINLVPQLQVALPHPDSKVCEFCASKQSKPSREIYK